MIDVKIIGGTIVDGSGTKRYRADIGIIGDKICEIGDLKEVDARESIDATGQKPVAKFMTVLQLKLLAIAVLVLHLYARNKRQTYLVI